MSRTLRWAVDIIIATGIAGAIAYSTWNANKQLPTLQPITTPQLEQTPLSTPVPSTAPATYSIESPPSKAAAPLPPLDESDRLVGDALTQLLGRQSFSAYFYPDRMIRRFVATIDNLLLHQAPVRMMPVKPVPPVLIAKVAESGLSLDPGNSVRYGSYIEVMETIDVPKLVDIYVEFYPLFQQAYRELGYPNGYFNNRLIEELDDLLATPNVPTQVALVQPNVVYQFEDPELESRSAGQKIMIRMGSSNAARVKIFLRNIRNEIMRRSSMK